MKLRQSIPGLLAFVLIVAFAGTADASCTGSNRISHGSAECLHGWWDNNSWPNDSKFGAQNLCPDWGKVVAKVDIEAASDRTWHLDDGDKRRGSTSNRVRGVYCCKDLGDEMCDKEDVVTAASCKTQFEASDANDDCTMDSDPTTDSTHCVFDLTCTYTDPNGVKYEHDGAPGVPWNRVDELEFCVDHGDRIRPVMSLRVDGC